MDKITQLTQEIEALETQAGALQVDDYEELYKILVVAYFKAKDINELHADVNPVLNLDMVEELATANDLNKLQHDEILVLTNSNSYMNEQLASIEKIISK